MDGFDDMLAILTKDHGYVDDEEGEVDEVAFAASY